MSDCTTLDIINYFDKKAQEDNVYDLGYNH